MADDTNHNGYSDDIEEEEEIDEAVRPAVADKRNTNKLVF